MLYAASLIMPIRKALGQKDCFQSSISTIIKQLPMSPDVSNMDSVLLGPKDMSGSNKKKIMEAIEAGIHPNICLMYLYTKETEAKDVNIPYMKCVKKITPAEVADFIKSSEEDHLNKTGALEVDFEFTSAELTEEPVSSGSIPQDITAATIEGPTKVSITKQPIPTVEIPPVAQSPLDVRDENNPAPPTEVDSSLYRNQMIENISSFEDWTLLKEALERDNMTRELISNNAEFTGVLQMLDVLDRKINAVWNDSSLSSDKKFEQIRDIGMQKSVMKATANSITAQKVIDLISAITSSAAKVVEDKVTSVNEALAKITTDKSAIADTSRINKAIQQRADLQLELLNINRGLIEMYYSMDKLASKEIDEMTSGLPSSNAFINNMMQPMNDKVFTPENASSLATKIMDSLQKNLVTMSSLEDRIQAVIRLIFNICEKDNDIIKYQQDMINMLKAQRVEDIVIRDSVLKYVLHLYVGAEDTCRTSTALTWSGIQSRRTNVLLVDITGKHKFERYGQDYMPLHEFFNSRVEKNFMCVASERRLEPEELYDLVSDLRSRLNYYGIINIIAEPDDSDAIAVIGKEALTINFITDCKGRSIETMRNCVLATQLPNVARKIIMIDTPINPLQIADALGADPTQVKLIMLPNISTIRACALKHDRPYEYSDVMKIYEEAFR